MKRTNPSSDNPKDRLEAFFQNRLENPDLEYDESQWQKMEALLDKADPRKPFYKRIGFFWLWISLLILLVGNGILFYLNTQSYLDSYSKNKSGQYNRTLKNRDGKKPDLPLRARKDSPSKSDPASAQGALPSEQTTDNFTKQPSSDLRTDFQKNSPGIPLPSQDFLKTREKIYRQEKLPYLVLPNDNPLEPVADDSIEANHPSEIQKFPVDLKINKLKGQALRIPKLMPDFIQNPKLDSIPLAQKKASQKPSHVFSNNRWSLGLSFAPELSTTGLTDYTKPGHRFGASLEYYLSPRLSLQAGALVSKSIYRASAEEYQVPYGYWATWTEGEIPESIDATCKIIDLTLQTKYYWLNRRLSRLFISGGISSYILKREKYKYNFEPYKPYRWDTWEIENQNRYWLGITQVSLGYELAIRPKLSLEVEPFMKIPLGKVGFGKVNLYSSGVLFHIRYYLGKD